MKELFALLKVILVFPLLSALWVLCPSKSKLLLEKDIDSWRKWKRVKPSSHLLAGAMLFAMFSRVSHAILFQSRQAVALVFVDNQR